jgi:hypothetical protein
VTQPEPHVHQPSDPIHDDHICNHVRCLGPECGQIGRLVDGEWQDA